MVNVRNTSVLKRREAPARFIVRLDAGHGGHQPGATYQDPETGSLLMEKDLTLPITLQIVEFLPTYVYPKLSRTQDEFVDLRTRALPRGHHDLFVSVHVNAAKPDRADTVRGLEAIIYSLADAWTVRLARKFLSALSRALQIPLNENPIRENPKLRVLQLSHEHQDRFGRSPSALRPATHPEIAGRGYGERHVGVPAVLLELGYLTHPQDRKIIRDRAKQTIAAQTIAEVIGGLHAEGIPAELLDELPEPMDSFVPDPALRPILDETIGQTTALAALDEPVLMVEAPKVQRRRKKKAQD
jgi:N-acetylmuramoyl-L-alanine amidase